MHPLVAGLPTSKNSNSIYVSNEDIRTKISANLFIPTLDNSTAAMATILKQRRNEASILASFSISKRNKPAYSRTCKDQSEANPAYSTPWKDRREANSVYSTNSKDRSVRTLFIPQIGKIEAKRSLFIPQIWKIEAERTRLIPEIVKIEAKKTNWIKVKRTEAVFLKLLWSPGIDSKELIPPAYALARFYNNPIPARFQAPLDCSQVPAPCWYF